MEKDAEKTHGNRQIKFDNRQDAERASLIVNMFRRGISDMHARDVEKEIVEALSQARSEGYEDGLCDGSHGNEPCRCQAEKLSALVKKG